MFSEKRGNQRKRSRVEKGEGGSIDRTRHRANGASVCAEATAAAKVPLKRNHATHARLDGSEGEQSRPSAVAAAAAAEVSGLHSMLAGQHREDEGNGGGAAAIATERTHAHRNPLPSINRGGSSEAGAQQDELEAPPLVMTQQKSTLFRDYGVKPLESGVYEVDGVKVCINPFGAGDNVLVYSPSQDAWHSATVVSYGTDNDYNWKHIYGDEEVSLWKCKS